MRRRTSGPSLQPTTIIPRTHVGKEWKMEVLPQVPHGPSTPVFKDVQVCLPFILQDKRGR